MSDLQHQAWKTFGVSLPVPRDKLKSMFRAKAKLLHADVSGFDSDAAFIAMKRVYDTLCANPEVTFAEDANKALRTTDGALLSLLGLGLGPTKNGRDCKRCEHKGYTISREGIFVRCKMCQYRHVYGGNYYGYCSYCFGVRQIKMGERIVYIGCYECKGTGEVEMFNPLLPKGLLR